MSFGMVENRGPSAAGGIEFVGGKTDSKVGSTSGTTSFDLTTGLTGGIASGASTGDFVLAAFGTGSNANRTLSIKDNGANDYTLILELYHSETEDTNLRFAYNTIVDADDQTTVFGDTGNANDAGTMAVMVFRGVGSLNSGLTDSYSFRNPPPNPPSVTPTVVGSCVVAVGAAAHDEGTQTFTSSDLSGFLTVGQDDTYDSSLGIGYIPDWVSGAVDPDLFGFTGTGNNGHSRIAITVVLEPA